MATRVRKVLLRNFKSIEACDVSLEDLTVLVGPNGSGKSNFVDAIRFVRDAVAVTLEHALRERGGVERVRRMSKTKPRHVRIGLAVALPDGRDAAYEFEVGAEKDGGFFVSREECRIGSQGSVGGAWFRIEDGKVIAGHPAITSLVERDSLALVRLSGTPEFRGLFDVLCGMSFHNLDPARMRDLQDSDAGHVFAGDGRNIAAVLRHLERAGDKLAIRHVNEFLRAVVPGIRQVQHAEIGPKETLEFVLDDMPKPLLASSMSDGTVRALGVLVALFHPAISNGSRPTSLVGIEEPEVAIHPGAVAAIGDALLSASERVQVLVTTHSPDLLDHEGFREQHLRGVAVQGGCTVIGPVGATDRDVIRERLFTPGELLRQDLLRPDPAATRVEAMQLSLFPERRDA
jgi:predicted ATPase